MWEVDKKKIEIMKRSLTFRKPNEHVREIEKEELELDE